MSKYIDLIYKGLKLLPRVVSSPWRVLPDFLIIGAQKAGTTSMARYLCRHPNIHLGKQTEVHFFDGGVNQVLDRYLLGEAWYRAYFPIDMSIEDKDLVFEKTPNYLSHPLAADRIYRHIPSAKLIVLLRNPVERAISQYFHAKNLGYEKLSPEEAIIKEEKRTKEARANRNYSSPEFKHFSYKRRGHYKKQLERYYEVFDEDQLLVLESERFFENQKQTLKKVFDFLNVSNNVKMGQLSPKNVSKDKKKVSKTVRQHLEQYYKERNKKLYDYLGKEFSW